MPRVSAYLADGDLALRAPRASGYYALTIEEWVVKLYGTDIPPPVSVWPYEENRPYANEFHPAHRVASFEHLVPGWRRWAQPIHLWTSANAAGVR